MPKIQPDIQTRQTLCVENPAPPNALIVFGASGDLAQRKLIPSLFNLSIRNLLPTSFYLLGCGRKKLTDDAFRTVAKQSISQAAPDAKPRTIEAFLKKLHYLSGDYTDPAFYQNIAERSSQLAKSFRVREPLIFYLAVPPLLYPDIVDNLRNAGLSCPSQPQPQTHARLVVEKPFGRNLDTAEKLNTAIHQCFNESQIYRIDHYIAKETVQNILMFRFANSIFEPLWNNRFIDSIQITIAEKVGVEHRAGYYDRTGALRDMFQNHMLGMLSFITLEPPETFDAKGIRNRKADVIRSIHPFTERNLPKCIVRGRYDKGYVDKKPVPAYINEPGIPPDSATETFVAAKLYIDNQRWKNVPFYLRTGKRLARKKTEIAIKFKKPPYQMFASVGLAGLNQNELVFRIQPEEGVSLTLESKRPGPRLCMSTLDMNFNYADAFKTNPPESYQRLLLDVMTGDQTLFTRQDDVELTWQFLQPILNFWQQDKSPPPQYPAGAESFPEAEQLINTDGRKWRPLNQNTNSHS